jgi:hypothetical protein
MTEVTPCARHDSATRRTSTQRSVGFEGRQLVQRDEPRRDPEARQQVLQQMQRAAVDRRAAQDLVARLQVRHQDRRRRAHP